MILAVVDDDVHQSWNLEIENDASECGLASP